MYATTRKLLEAMNWGTKYESLSEESKRELDDKTQGLVRGGRTYAQLRDKGRADYYSLWTYVTDTIDGSATLREEVRTLLLEVHNEEIVKIRDAFRSYAWYDRLSTSTKTALSKRIAELVMGGVLYHNYRIKSGPENNTPPVILRFLGLALPKSEELVTRMFNEITNVGRDALYSVGHVVKVGSINCAINQVVPWISTYRYEVCPWKGAPTWITEEQISSFVSAERGAPRFNIGDIVMVGYDGRLSIIKQVELAYYPPAYVLDNGNVMRADQLTATELKSDDIYKCDACSTIFIKAMHPVHVHDGRKYCPTCKERYFVECRACGRVALRTSGNSSDYCDDCYRERTTECHHCGRRVNNDNVVARLGKSFCRLSCANGWAQSIMYTRYSDKVPPVFFGCGDGPKEGYGVELEVDYGEDWTAGLAIRRTYEQCYIKHDGSLNSGMEVITHPCTLAYHQEEFPWDDIMRMITDDGGFSSAETCGIHIHASRSLFGVDDWEQDCTISDINCFIDDNWYKVLALARRHEVCADRWARKPSFTDATDDTVEKVRKLRAERSRGDRYVAVNVQNRYTVEFRIFGSTTIKWRLLSHIEFVDALISYCKANSPPSAYTWGDFVDSLDGEKYPNLLRTLKELNLNNEDN